MARFSRFGSFFVSCGDEREDGGPGSHAQTMGLPASFSKRPRAEIPKSAKSEPGTYSRGSQSTAYIFAGDRWNSGNLSKSQYVWWPLSINGTTMSMSNYAQTRLGETRSSAFF